MRSAERADDLGEALRSLVEGYQASMWTAMPCFINSFDPATQTASVQITIQGRQLAKDGSVALVTMPLCLDCPVQFPGGGGVSLTFPVAPGDEALVVFANRSIDGWWQSGGVQAPVEARMHDLSDGMVLLGFRSKPKALADFSTSAAQLRSEDGSTVVELNPEGRVVTVTAPGGITINGDVTLNGKLDATGDVTADGISLQHHTHTDPQGGSTGEPT